MNPYSIFVSEWARLFREAGKIPPGKMAPPPRQAAKSDAPLGLIFSPHPDDECIAGGLALRLARECEWKILNVAVTLGSRRERRQSRLKELQGACRYLGFGLTQARAGGLEHVAVTTRKMNPALWASYVAIIANLLRRHRPAAVFLPHALDKHPTHIGVHWLVMDALLKVRDMDCWLVETEFWGQLASPNLLVEISVKDVADLVAATSCHRGEVKRNPYHLRLPAWMQDNVRRGGELVGGMGQRAPAFVFGQLFQLSRWRDGKAQACWETGRILPSSTNLDVVFTSLIR